ncbi:MAG: hypothetical protein NTX11_02025 [Candidatus Saccharibacteria bacterium]|nr:hypothetical protein [Candidatus Saccharibacteria bacterium]
MNDDTIQDLKQFIEGTVYQHTASIRNELKIEINRLDVKLSSKIDDLSDAVADALENSNAETDKQLRNHEVRITKLEGSAA